MDAKVGAPLTLTTSTKRERSDAIKEESGDVKGGGDVAGATNRI